MKPDGFRRISIHTDVEFGGVTQALGGGLHPLSPSKITNTIMEEQKGMDDEESMWNMSDGSNSILPKHRVK